MSRDGLLLTCASYFYRAGVRSVPRNALVQRLGDLLAVAVAAESLLIGGTADEGNFRQNSGHGSFGQHHEAGFFNSAIAQARILT